MSKVAIQGNASGTGTFTIAAPNSNTDRTLTLPDEAGTVLTSASDVLSSTDNIGVQATKSTPMFIANMSSNQSLSATTWTTASFNTEVIDSDGWYDNSTYRFTPQVEGYYRFSAKGYFLRNNATERFILDLSKNSNLGSNRLIDVYLSMSDGFQLSGTTVLYMNGTTDYAYVSIWSINATTFNTNDGTQFTAELVRAV